MTHWSQAKHRPDQNLFPDTASCIFQEAVNETVSYDTVSGNWVCFSCVPWESNASDMEFIHQAESLLWGYVRMHFGSSLEVNFATLHFSIGLLLIIMIMAKLLGLVSAFFFFIYIHYRWSGGGRRERGKQTMRLTVYILFSSRQMVNEPSSWAYDKGPGSEVTLWISNGSLMVLYSSCHKAFWQARAFSAYQHARTLPQIQRRC